MSKLFCKIIGHVPVTTYLPEGGNRLNCEGHTTCKICGTPLVTPPQKHQWAEGYLEHPCHYIKKCQICGFVIFDYPRHEFDTAHPIQEGCTQHTVCLKCSVRSEPVQAHLYSAKAVLKGCMAYHTCQRCGQRDGGAWAHAFGEPIQEGCITSHTCQRCGHREELLVQHEFKFVRGRESEVAKLLTTWNTYICEKCGLEKVEETSRYTDW
jgi:hypothetical protein